jgi:Dolichyl-phosphate-mannose-protein mannosyltransferase
MMVLRFLGLGLLLLLVVSGGPGLWLTRKLRWSPPERLVGAFAVSGVGLYLSSGLIYVLRLPRLSYFFVSLACLGCAAAGRAHGRLLWASREVRWMLGGFAGLFLWALLLLAMVRSYSGALWSGDWIEHYERAQFFLEHQPAGTLFLNRYLLPARPPLLNLLSAHFLAQVGERYDLLQVIFVFFNLLAVLPCWLLARLFVRRAGGRAGRIALLCLLAASPFFLENATYLWTKGLANFYVLAGLWFYLRGWRKSDPGRMAAAGLALAAGVLTHYSAAPFALLLLLHGGLGVVPRCPPARRGQFLRALLPGAALLSTWVGWSLALYGAGPTFGSNTTAQAAGAMSVAANLRKVALNLLHSLVPHPLRLSYADFSAAFIQPNGWGKFRDYFFLIFQTNLIFGLGCLGGLVVLFLLWRTAREPAARPRAGRGFWFALMVAGTLCTVATHPTLDAYGVAHVCSQPLLLLGVTWLAASFSSLPGALRLAVVGGCVFDFLAGIFVPFSLQAGTVALDTQGGRQTIALTTGLLNPTALFNALAKHQLAYVFWGDHFAGLLPLVQLLALAGFAAVLRALIQVTPELRTPDRRPGPAARILLFLSLALGAAAGVGIRAQDAAIVPAPPDLAACVRAAQENFDSSSAHYNLGLALYRTGHVQESFDQWTEALLLLPGHPQAHYFTEVVAAAYALPPSADLQAARAVRQEPHSAEAHLALAAGLWTHGHRAPARAEAEEALRLKPGYPAAEAALREMSASGRPR